MKGKMGLALVVLFVFALLASACGAGSAPTASPAGAKPTGGAASAAGSSPTAASASGARAAASPVAKPSASIRAGSGGSMNWKSEWDVLVAAARKEGKVVVAGPRGDLYRNGAMAFQKAYPDIQLEYTGFGAPEFLPKIIAERQGSQYLWDVYVGGSEGQLTLKDMGALDPLKPALLLPEVLDDSKWLGGFNDGWLDLEQKYSYQFFGYISYGILVNRDVAPESELSSFDQILDPKWKGKITTQDPRQPSAASTYFTVLLLLKGEDWLRKLLAHDLAIRRDPRLMLEGLVRGTYPMGIGATKADYQQFEQQGLTANLQPLDPDNPAGGRLTAGSSHAALVNKGPHLNAAKVFVNWLLSQEGQRAYVEAMNLNSRRTDVEGPSETAPRPGVKYIDIEKEEFVTKIDKTREIAGEMLK